MENPTNIFELDIKSLKALSFDEMQIRDNANNNILMLSREIEKRNTVNTEHGLTHENKEEKSD